MQSTGDIDPRFRPMVDALRNYRDVTGGKMMMSSFQFEVKGKTFTMFGRKQFVPKPPKARIDPFRRREWVTISILGTAVL